jgi:pSer/pThr/pTyr-binding forkhead associated (FHA) protein
VATELRKSPVGLGAELLKELEEKAVEPAVRPRGAAPASTEPLRPPSALQFTCVAGPVKGKSYPIGKRTLTIGRSPTADIFLEELSVSREHAVIRPIEKRVEIVDLESRNGVEVNGKRVKVKPINVGDKVTIGKCIFIVEAMES